MDVVNVDFVRRVVGTPAHEHAIPSPLPAGTAYILTISGNQFALATPSQARVSLNEIPKVLSHIARFTGHTAWHYSVAQHSVMTALYLYLKGAPLMDVAAGAIHDAHEAYFGDMAQPVKTVVPVKAVEDRIQAEVVQAFGLKPDMVKRPAVKHADLVSLLAERNTLLPRDISPWSAEQVVTETDLALYPAIERWTHPQAEIAFRCLCWHLMPERMAAEGMAPLPKAESVWQGLANKLWQWRFNRRLARLRQVYQFTRRHREVVA